MKLLTPSGRRGYRRRILLDLAIFLLLMALRWGGAGYPLPEGQLFRSMERQRLLEPSEVVAETKVAGGWPVTVGFTDHRIHAAATTLDRFYSWDRTGKPQLILLPGLADGTPVFAAVDVPAGAAAADLTMELSLQGQINADVVDTAAVYTAEGTAAGSLFLFTLEPRADDPDSILGKAESFWFLNGWYSARYRDLPPHTLTFYDAGGGALSTVTGGAP